jgi:glutamate--cysteine ligase
MEAREALRNDVPRLGLKAPLPGGRTLQDIAGQVLDIARSGLAARARLNGAGDNESGYLSTLDEVVAARRTNAERLLERYKGEWAGDLGRVYAEESF